MSTTTDTREKILTAASELIYSRSYADVGVAEICSQAGVKKGSFYHFFPSKRDLTIAVLDNSFENLKSRKLSEVFSNSINPMARLTRMIEMTYEMQTQFYNELGFVPGCQFGNIGAEQSTQDTVLRDHVASIFKQMENLFQKTLSEAIDKNDIGQINVEATAQAMLAYLEGVLLMAKTRNNPDMIKKLLPGMLDIRIA